MQIIVVDSIDQGIERAKDVLYQQVDRKTALFLSGGKTPMPLYACLAKEQILKPASVGLIDERFGEVMHENSNEKMVKDSGLLHYLEKIDAKFFPILQAGLQREQTADKYDQTVRDLFFHMPKNIGILGIGTDGHIAGIVPNRKDFIDPLFAETKNHVFVSSFNDEKGIYKERISLTFAGLSLLDFMLVFVFGADKKQALTQMFTTGPLEDIPARFFNMSEASKKTLIITDQKV